MAAPQKCLQTTLVLVKPDGLARGLAGECLRRFERAGLEIVAARVVRLTRPAAKRLRADLRRLPPALLSAVLDYATEGNLLALVLRGPAAVAPARALCGHADPAQARAGTIRGDFALGDMRLLAQAGRAVRNVVHSAATPRAAAREIRLVFGHPPQFTP